MADADLDAELLALAGGESSDEENGTQSRHKSHSSPAPPLPSSSSLNQQQSLDQPAKMARKGVAKPVRRAKKSKKEEFEEGELSSTGSQNSLQSASMSESDSEGEAAAEEDDGPIFPYEKLYYSAKDKAEIMALPEIQREELLSERSQQVDRHNQDLALRRLLASREREEARAQAKKNKRKAGTADLEEGQRKSSRQKMTLGGRKVGEASDAIEAYKRQREQKGRRDEARRRDAAARKSLRRGDSNEAFSDADAEGESDVEWDDKPDRAVPVPKDDSPVELKDIQRVRVGRSNFAQVCFYPKFDDLITGCFARVNVGPNRDTGENVYRVCIVKKFTEGRPYALEGPNGRSFTTTQYALLAHGTAEKEFPFIACSDSSFTEAEFSRWRQTMVVETCKMPTKSMLAAKVTDINNLINHNFTKDELNEKLRRQGASDNKMAIWKRLELDKALQEAVAAGDDEEITKIQAEIVNNTGPKLAFGTSLTKSRSEQSSQQERLAEINRRNQKLNTENVRRAQLEEQRAHRKAAAAIARGEAVVADPFARVKTRAKVHHDVSEAKRSSSQKEDEQHSQSTVMSPANGNSETPKRSQTPGGSEMLPTKGLGVIRHHKTDDEVIAALDLDIDIEI